jgi:hypothetical protein
MKNLNKLIIFIIFTFLIEQVVTAGTQCGSVLSMFSPPRSGTLNNESVCVGPSQVPAVAYEEYVSMKYFQYCQGKTCTIQQQCPNNQQCPNTPTTGKAISFSANYSQPILGGKCGGSGTIHIISGTYTIGAVECFCECPDSCLPDNKKNIANHLTPKICDDGSLVKLSNFTTVPTNKGISLNWNTETELDSQGFRIWRAIPNLSRYCGCSGNIDDYTQIQVLDEEGKPVLIPAKGSTTSGFDYSYLDEKAKPGIAYCYALEDVDSKGESKFYFEYVAFTPDGLSEETK